MMNMYSAKGATGEAHSKLILVGEHAVVYGTPAIAIPFPLKVWADITKGQGAITISSHLYTGILDGIPKEMKGILEMIKKAFELLNQPLIDINIKLTSEIPMGRGLGSSAAISMAVARGIYSFFGKMISREELFILVELAEAYAHGKPSGIDMMAVASSSPIFFMKEEGGCTLNVPKPLFIVVADSGKIGDTRRAVEMVKENYVADPVKVDAVVNRIGEITEKAREAISKGDSTTLGELLNKNHKELIELGVSDDLINSLVETAKEAGAIGTKLTGGGLGGCMIALAKSMEDADIISRALIKDGAYMAWYFSSDQEEIVASYKREGEIS